MKKPCTLTICSLIMSELQNKRFIMSLFSPYGMKYYALGARNDMRTVPT